nr:hypothetical protein GCM10020092_090670 [Actinoplanes digitatis]
MTIIDGFAKLTSVARVAPSRAAPVADQPDAGDVALRGAVGDVAGADPAARRQALRQRRRLTAAGGGERVPGQGGAAEERLEAARVAARAHRTVRVDLDVADVAGAAVHPAVDVAAEVDAAADARADLDEEEVVDRVRDTAVPLTDRHDVDVVVHDRRAAVLAGQRLPDGIAVPARHDRRGDRHAVAEADRAGHPDADGVEPLVGAVGAGLGEQLVDPVQDRLGPGPDVGGLLVRRDGLELSRW